VKTIFKILPAAFLILLWAAPLAVAQVQAAGPSGKGRGPLAISSDRLESDDNSGEVTFIGSVVARQDGMTITCDRMKVFYSQKPKEKTESGEEPSGSALSGSDRQIERVECYGNVKMVDGEHMAVGDTGRYLAQAVPRTMILTGNAQVWQGRNSVTGHEVTYDIDSRRSVVVSEKRTRVQTIYQQEKK